MNYTNHQRVFLKIGHYVFKYSDNLIKDYRAYKIEENPARVFQTANIQTLHDATGPGHQKGQGRVHD